MATLSTLGFSSGCFEHVVLKNKIHNYIVYSYESICTYVVAFILSSADNSMIMS